MIYIIINHVYLVHQITCLLFKLFLLFFTSRYLKKQFQNADKNSNGSLTFDECLGLTEQLNIKMDKVRLRELFQVGLQG